MFLRGAHSKHQPLIIHVPTRFKKISAYSLVCIQTVLRSVRSMGANIAFKSTSSAVRGTGSTLLTTCTGTGAGDGSGSGDGPGSGDGSGSGDGPGSGDDSGSGDGSGGCDLITFIIWLIKVSKLSINDPPELYSSSMFPVASFPSSSLPSPVSSSSTVSSSSSSSSSPSSGTSSTMYRTVVFAENP